MDKKAYKLIAGVLFLAVVLAGGFYLFGGSFGQQSIVDAEDVLDDDTADLTVCSSSTIPYVDVTTKNTSDPSIVNLDGDVNATGIWKNPNTGQWEEFVTDQTISSDSTINLPTYEGAEYLLFFENISNNYFGKVYKGTVKCKANDPIVVKFEQVATLALNTYNNGNTGTENANGTAHLALGSGETADVIFRLKPNEEYGWITADPSPYVGSLSAYAPPGPCVESDANFASIFLEFTPSGGENFSAITNPDTMLRGHPLDTNSSGSRPYELKAAAGATDFLLVDTTWKIKAQSGVNPGMQHALLSVYQPQLIKNRLITDPAKQWGWYCRDPFDGSAIIASSTERLFTS